MQGDTHAFIVRIWCEALDKEGRTVAWRGSIEHVGHDKRLSFQDMHELVRIIQEQARLDTGQSASKWRSFLARRKDESS